MKRTHNCGELNKSYINQEVVLSVRGSDEVKKGVVTVKNMDEGIEEKIAEKEIISVLRRHLK